MILLFSAIAIAAGIVVMPKKSESSENKDAMNPLNKYDGLFQKYGTEYGVPWKILKRMAYVESTLGQNSRVAIGLKNPNDIKGSTSTDGLSWGLMQMTLATAYDYDKMATPAKLNDPDYSIRLAAQHTKLLIKYFPINSDNYERNIVMAYNQGQGNQLAFIKAEKAGTLASSSYPAARNHWAKYLKAKEIIP